MSGPEVRNGLPHFGGILQVEQSDFRLDIVMARVCAQGMFRRGCSDVGTLALGRFDDTSERMERFPLTL